MKRILPIVCIIANGLLPAANSFSQSLSPKVIPSSGGYFTGGSKSLSWTMGETVQKTLQSGNKILTQGFQQPYFPVKILHLKTFIEGLYVGGGLMHAMLYENGMSQNANACDSITVELHDTSPFYSLILSVNGLLLSDGNAAIQFPSSLQVGSYYLVIRHRNSLETWSKNPISITPGITQIDFTSP